MTVNGDDQKYILKSDTCPITVGHEDEKHVKIFVDRWVNFANTGTPGYGWLKYQEGNKKNYLQINKDAKMDTESSGYTNRMDFWHQYFP